MIGSTVERDSPAAHPVCVTTRVRVRGLRGLVRFAWHYRRVSRTLGGTPGLMHVALLAEGPLTWHMLSVWRSEEAMIEWAVAGEHVDAVRATYGITNLTRESWSGRWQLAFISPSARCWSKAPAMETALDDWIGSPDAPRQHPKPRRRFDARVATLSIPGSH